MEYHHHFVFSQKLLDASLRSAYSVLKRIAKHTCRHLVKLPEKLTRSTQRSVTWQTGSEYRRLTVPSGRTLNYVSFVQKIEIPKYLGPPLVYSHIAAHFPPSHDVTNNFSKSTNYGPSCVAVFYYYFFFIGFKYSFKCIAFSRLHFLFLAYKGRQCSRIIQNNVCS